MRQEFVQNVIGRLNEICCPADFQAECLTHFNGKFGHAQGHWQPVQNGCAGDAKSLYLREQQHRDAACRDQHINTGSHQRFGLPGEFIGNLLQAVRVIKGRKDLARLEFQWRECRSPDPAARICEPDVHALE